MVDGLHTFLTRAKRFVSPRVGLISRIHELCTEVDDARVYFAATDVASTSRYGLPVDCFDHNGGAGLTRDVALAAALGETIERYACSVYFPNKLHLSTYSELPGRAVDPNLLSPYSPTQYARSGCPFRPFAASTRLSWIQGTSLEDGQSVWYPAGLTYVPYIYGPDETPIAPSVSTGLALGSTPDEAILSGLCEVVERDAVMIMWWNRLAAPEIKVPAGSWLAQVMDEHFSVPEVTFRLFDITTDTGIPTVFCVALGHARDSCAIACGAATRPDPAQAALKALIEAAQTRAWVRSLTRQYGPPDPGEGFASITTFEEHVRLYGQAHMKDALAFLLDHEHTTELGNLPNLSTEDLHTTIVRYVRALGACDLHPIALDVTPPDVAEQELWAIKVAIPGMVELNGDHNWPFFGYQRLYHVPVKTGHRILPSTEAEMNPCPHPFP